MAEQVEVVTVFSPRNTGWESYLPLLTAQRQTCEFFGHSHLVVTDSLNLSSEYNQLHVPLGDSLMRAMIRGLIARLEFGGPKDIVFVDVDCLVARDLRYAFNEYEMFDLRLTRRANPIAPINNGAMYVKAHGIDKAKVFFERALKLCGDHWGADQEAISAAAQPVPDGKRREVRHGCLIQFEEMKPFNVVPKIEGAMHGKHGVPPFIVHFKGATKDWMVPYAEKFILKTWATATG